ncbi:MAG: GNAT family N-acetyltransferase [Candidatus Sericytochromatia bacterium]
MTPPHPDDAPWPTGVRLMTPDDIPAVIALQRRVFPGMPPWAAAQLENHLRVFPAGQLVAVGPSGGLVGSASSLIVLWADFDELAGWKELTGDGYFTTHNPDGLTLYGADIGVDPAARGLGVGGRLYRARKAVVRQHGLQRMITGGRLPGYGAEAAAMTAEQYVAEVQAGTRRDPVLSFQLGHGFTVRGVIPGYLGFDEASGGYATLLEWTAPAHRPGSGPLVASTGSASRAY